MKQSRDINKELIDAFPEIAEQLEAEMAWQDGLDTGSTLIFEDVFVKAVVMSLSLPGRSDFITRAFRFVEDMYESQDEYSINVADVAFVEAIASYEEREQLEEYMLPKTLESYLKCKTPF